MSDASGPTNPPPEVPEEFADAYREAYERALAEQADAGSHRAQEGAEGLEEPEEQDDLDDVEDLEDEPVPERVDEPDEPDEREQTGGAHANWAAIDRFEPEDHPPARPGWTEYSVESGWERYRTSRWFVPSLLLASALLLVVAAYGVGRLFATNFQDAQPAASTSAGATVPASDPSERTPGSGQHSQQPQQDRKQQHQSKPNTVWHGSVTPVAVGSAAAGCVDSPGVDAAGHKVTYQPANAIDGHSDTTWRCPGKAIGRRLVLHLPQPVSVGEVGLIPGYAKTDPKSGADRYAENNRITRVRWTLGHGTSVVQHLSGAAGDRSLRTVRVPRTRTDRIVLQVLGVRKGPRNTTCVSEVRVARAG